MSSPASSPPVLEVEGDPVEPTTEAQTETLRDRLGRRRLLVVGAVFAAVIVLFGLYRVFAWGRQSTDDATVDGDVVPLSVQVGGQIAMVPISDNARVKKGDVVLQLDTVELEAKVRQAKGELDAAKAQADAADAQARVADAAARGGLSSAKAQVTTSWAQVGTAEAQIAAAQAQLTKAQTDAKKADADLQRGRTLIAASAITQERFDALQAAADSAQAAVLAAQSQLAGAQDARTVAAGRAAEANGQLDTNSPVDAKIASAQANADLAHARVETAQAAFDLAQLALSRATLVAPSDGTVSKLTVRVGQVLVPGQQIAFLVPDESYVIANFKESQISDMKKGNPVDIALDAYPGETFHGTVDTLAPATGARFSLIPPDNATGNFVKVVQRVPVKILWSEAPHETLRPGLSAEVTVHVSD
jgi:membrane fusion protein, multidrug efflux system